MPSKPVSHLVEAAADVEAFMTTLNTTQSRCGECDVIHYENVAEYRAHQMLSAMVDRLRQLAERFRDAPDT